MDKLIRIPKTNKTKEPLLNVEERRHNYDDRRSYTSYAEITKDFEDDLRCQDDDNEDDLYNAKPPSAPCSSGPHNDGSSSIVTTEDDNHQFQRKIRGDSVEQQQLLIGNNNGNVGVGGRQRKQPILLPPPPPQHANDASVGGEECASMGRDTRSATVRTTVSPAMAVGARRIGETDVGGTDDGGSIRTDNHLKAKSFKTLQESIRESLTINNSASFNGQGRYQHNTNHLIFEMNEFYIDMLERLTEMRKEFGNVKSVSKVGVPRSTDPNIKKEFEEWILADAQVLDQVIVKPEVKTIAEARKYDQNIMKHFENIEKLDREIELTDSKWKEMKRERMEVQNNLCNQIENCINSFDFQKSQVFLELCASEVDVDEKSVHLENNDNVVSAVTEMKKCKSAALIGKNFIQRNIHIAKNMSFPVSLTDEEKIKLDAILTEEDNIEDNEECSDNDHIIDDVESIISTDDGNEIVLNQSEIKSKNEYKLVDEDEDRVSEINEQIKSLSNLVEYVLDINDVECQLEDDVKLGKNWKYSLLDHRLKEIDEKLADITQSRDNEVVEINQPDTSLDLVDIAI